MLGHFKEKILRNTERRSQHLATPQHMLSHTWATSDLSTNREWVSINTHRAHASKRTESSAIERDNRRSCEKIRWEVNRGVHPVAMQSEEETNGTG